MAREPATLNITITEGEDWYLPLRIMTTRLAYTAPTIARNTAYTVGEWVLPATPNGYVYEATSAGTSHASNEPTWPTILGRTVSDGTVTWRCEEKTSEWEELLDTTSYVARFTVRDDDWDGDTQVTATTGNSRIIVGFTPAKWVANTAYSLGQQVVPTSLIGYVFECVVAGTSHATTEPTWVTTLGDTQTDGTVTWRCTTTDATVVNLYVSLADSYTSGLTDWGYGVYDLELEDTYGNIKRILHGSCRLSRET